MQKQDPSPKPFEVSRPKLPQRSGNFRPFCVSLDWLSISCVDQGFIFFDREEQPSGYKLVSMNHGSTIYQHLFTIYDPMGSEIGELHAHPYNKAIDPRSVIVKADNALLYQRDGVEQLFACLTSLALYYKGVNRIDLACDQNEFYGGRLPEKLIKDYFNEKRRPILKLGINSGIDFFDFGIYTTQNKDGGFSAWSRMPIPNKEKREKQLAEIRAKNNELRALGLPLLDETPPHVVDDPADISKRSSRTSVTWGTRSNGVQVQLYNKTKELQEVKMKHHIVDAWKAAGLDVSRPVYRVEIRIHGRGKGLINPITGKQFEINLVDCLLQEQVEEMFFAFAERHFKFFQNTKHKKIRQNKPILLWERDEPTLKPKQTKAKRDPSRFTLILANAIQKERAQMAALMAREEANVTSTRTDYATRNTLLALDKVADYFRDAYLLEEWMKQHDLEGKLFDGDLLKRLPPDIRMTQSWKHSSVYEEILSKTNRMVRPRRSHDGAAYISYSELQHVNSTEPPDLQKMADAVETSFRTITYCEYVTKAELEEATASYPLEIDWDSFPYD